MIEKQKQSAVTLLELLVVVMIMGILASIAVTVYTGHVDRARVAACRDMIRQLELAVNRYEVDTGQFPPTSSGLPIAPDALVYEGNSTQGSFGSGYLQLALVHSLSGNIYQPLHQRWLGPYLELDEDQMGDRFGMPVTASTPKGYVQILDPWGMPFYYLHSNDYASLGATQYPVDHPYYGTETYYNPSSVQIFSMGRNGVTYAVPERGEETDDVNNWRKYGLGLGSSGGGTRRSRIVARTLPGRSGRPGGETTKINDFSGNSGKSGNSGAWGTDTTDPGRRPVAMTFPMPDDSHLMFRWPKGWSKRGNKVSKPSDKIQPQWLFQVKESVSFENLGYLYRQFSDVEIFFEGLDPTGTVPDSFVLETRSESTPEIDLQEDAEGKPYHLLFAFKNGKYTCWWAANFTSVKSMDKGRLFITGVVRTKIPVTKSVR